MKRHVLLWGLILGVGLAASMCRGEVKPLGTEIPRPNGPVAKSGPQPGAPVSCLARVGGWLTYRQPIRGSFCRGSKLGAHEHHPPLYAYFPPANGCAPPHAPQQLASAQPEQAPMPRPWGKGTIQQTSATAPLPTVPKPKHVLEGLFTWR